MRPHLGPPRELVVRRKEGPHHRAMRILWSAGAIFVGVSALAMTITNTAVSHSSAGLGPPVAKAIVAAAAIGSGVLDFKAPTKTRLVLTVVLGWTAVMVVVVWW